MCVWASRHHSSLATQIVFRCFDISHQVLQIKIELQSQMWKDSIFHTRPQSFSLFLHKFFCKKPLRLDTRLSPKQNFYIALEYILLKHKNKLYIFLGNKSILVHSSIFLKTIWNKWPYLSAKLFLSCVCWQLIKCIYQEKGQEYHFLPFLESILNHGHLWWKNIFLPDVFSSGEV